MVEGFNIVQVAGAVVRNADTQHEQRTAEFMAIVEERGQTDLLWQLGTLLLMVTQGTSVEEAGVMAQHLLEGE